MNGLRIDTSSAPAPAPVEPGTGDAALDKALTILNSKYATGGKYHGMLEGGGKKTGFDATLDVSSTPDITTVKFTAEPFPFFDNGVSYFANYYAVKGGFASDEQIGVSGNGGGLGDPFEVNESLEKVYIGKCFLDCQFTGAREQSYHGCKACVLVGQHGNMGAGSHVCKRWLYRLHRECKRRYSKERCNADRDSHRKLYADDDTRVRRHRCFTEAAL